MGLAIAAPAPAAEFLHPEAAGLELRRLPDDPFQQGIGVDAEGVGELQQRVRSGDALAALKLADRGGVNGSEVTKVFLADPGSGAVDAQVRPEAAGEAGGLYPPARLS